MSRDTLFRNRPVELIAIGASTGGPPALRTVLVDLVRATDLPIAIVQHLFPEFVRSLGEWIASHCGRQVIVPVGMERLEAERIYLAAGDRHLIVGGDRRLHLIDSAPVHSCRPSVDVFFESVAETFGACAIGVLLTGMGEDGARGMAALKRAGGFTIAQNPDSSAATGMPRAARALGGVGTVLELEKIGGYIASRISVRPVAPNSLQGDSHDVP